MNSCAESVQFNINFNVKYSFEHRVSLSIMKVVFLVGVLYTNIIASLIPLNI